VDVGHVELHGAALGDFPGFIQVGLRALGAGAGAGEIPQPGASEEAAGKIVKLACAAEAGQGGVQFTAGGLERLERGCGRSPTRSSPGEEEGVRRIRSAPVKEPSAPGCYRIQHLNPRIADLDVVAAAAQFLEADVALARAVLDRRGVRSVVAFHCLVLPAQNDVLDGFSGSVRERG
jgi:hypothetical protein